MLPALGYDILHTVWIYRITYDRWKDGTIGMLMVAVSTFASLSHSSYLRSSDINEAKIISAANYFISLGLKTAGYEYINIDVRVLPTYHRLT